MRTVGITQEDFDLIRNNLHMHLPDLHKLVPHIKYSTLEYRRKTMRKYYGFVADTKRIKHNVNDDYFSIITPESAYWAGFLAADGCIQKNRVKLKLAAKDTDHVIAFKRHIGFTGDTLHYNETLNGVVFPQTVLYVTSDKIVNDLYNIYNITTKKSLTLQPPNITEYEHVLPFIVGYIDGDGNIGYSGGNPILQVLGTYDLLSWIKEHLDIWYPNRIGARVLGRTRGNVLRYSISGAKVVQFVGDVRNTDLPILKRKWYSIN